MPKKIFNGTITSDKMNKTVVVTVYMTKRHPIYSKVVKVTKKLKARNEIGAKLGDVVAIEEVKPFSKDVTWIVKEKVSEKA